MQLNLSYGIYSNETCNYMVIISTFSFSDKSFHVCSISNGF
jgi:hypothetical protein